MHDREDAGPGEIGLFLGLVARETGAPHAGPSVDDRLDDVGMQHGVELALRQHRLDRLVVGQAGQLQAGRRREADVLVEFGEPFDRLMRHAVFMFEDAAQPERRGDQIEFHADLLADQVGRPGDVLRSVGEDEAVPEAAMREDRSARNGRLAIARRDVGRGRAFGDVVLVAAQEAPMARGRIGLGQDVQLNAVRSGRCLPSAAGRSRSRRRRG